MLPVCRRHVGSPGVPPTAEAYNPHMTQHSNKQFSSGDAGKLFVFALLALPPTIFVVGIIPVLLLLFGIFMLRKSGDFGHIETAARNFRIICTLAFLGLVAVAGHFFIEHLGRERESWSNYALRDATAVAAISLIPLFYIAVMQVLFLNPMRANRDWLAAKFSPARERPTSSNAGEIDIIKGERLRSFSVADELLKWAKLKDDGHITEQEFAEARRKLLERN